LDEGGKQSGGIDMTDVFQAKVVRLGDMVDEFKSEKMMILFQENVPDELADYCVIHNNHKVMDVVGIGDTLFLGDEEYKIVYVGNQVQKNLTDLGHITLRFNDNCEGENLEGSLYLEDKAIAAVSPGDSIRIVRM